MHDTDLIAQVCDAAKNYSSIVRLTLFGSRARKTHGRTSDFDICVSCADDKDFVGFSFDIEDINTYYSIDLLRYENVNNDLLKDEISKDGVILYESASEEI